MEKAYGRTLKALRSRIQKAMIHPPVTTNAIPLLYSWARSGTTLLNKCLSAMGHLVLSETHPKINTGVHSPRWQATHWYNIDIPKGTPWSSCILKLNDIAVKQDRSLIVRDWTIASFYPSDVHDPLRIRQLQAHKVLGERCKPVAYIRNAIDCALSFATFHHWTAARQLDSFARAYLQYARRIKQDAIPLVYYEDFCQNPTRFLAELCITLGIRFSDKWQNFSDVIKILGDTYTAQKRGSRAVELLQIKRLPRRKIISQLQRHIVMNKELHLANKLLGIK
jgi:hypothetical protein